MVRMVDNLDLCARAKDQQCTMRCRRKFKFALGCSCTVFQEVRTAVEIRQLWRVHLRRANSNRYHEWCFFAIFISFFWF